MASEIKVDTIVNAGGDNDSGIDLSTNDVVAVKTANTERMRVDASGGVAIGATSVSSGFKTELNHSGETYGLKLTNGSNSIRFGAGGPEISATGARLDIRTTDSNEMRFYTNNSERARIDSSGNVLIGKTSAGANVDGVQFEGGGVVLSTKSGDVAAIFNRKTNDGRVIEIRQDNTTEGSIDVSGSTVSLAGFSGTHESSGIATNTPIGTVVSTIDELDTYPTGTTKAGQTRADHAKVEVSDTVGDSAVYGVVSRFDENDKVFVASVGIGSVRVTGACAKGDLLESNGDGTAKVQSDDIVRSKTIGKVTIGNSNTGVKLVSCVLYCG